MQILQPISGSYHGAVQEPILSQHEAKEIIMMAKTISPLSGQVTLEGTDAVSENSAIRDVTVYPIPHDINYSKAWDAMTKVFNSSNETFLYNLNGIFEKIQLLQYTAPSNGYDWHIDIGSGQAEFRKLSVSLALNDDYEGGEICLFERGEMCFKPEAGSAICFSSFIPHRIKPVTKGERWSLVAWASGPRFM